MDKIVNWLHKYGYVFAEELIFRIVPFAIPILRNPLGIIGFGVLFGVCHYPFGLLPVIGACVGGVGLGWLYVALMPYSPLNIIAVIGIHLAWAKWGLKK